MLMFVKYIYSDLTRDFELDITVKEKPVLDVDDLLLLNYYWARDTSIFPMERHRVQFVLVLLLLFATGCWPAELIDAKKNKRRRPGLDDHETGADDVIDESFDDTEVGADSDFGFDNNHDSTVADLSSKIDNDNNSDNDDIAMSSVDTELRQFDVLCYEDVCLLVVWNPVAGERDVLAMEVKLAYYKGAKRRLKPWVDDSSSPASP